ncbi:MAG: HD domain-containing protein [Oscillospiraceae bacterium]
MGTYINANVIHSHDVINIVRDTLKRVDSRLVDHGERVAYILLKMLSCSSKYSSEQITNICILGLFHDVGAYKTDEIDKLLQFETKDILGHSIYGYLFLKNCSPFQNWSKAILYHHANYKNSSDEDPECMDIAFMIGLADRIDVLMQNENGNFSFDKILKYSGTKFNPAHIALFAEGNQKYKIVEMLHNLTYRQILAEAFANIHFTAEEINQYLHMLIYSIDFRSEYTVTHTINTVAYSTAIAKKMHFDTEELSKIYYGALLHDLGKISIPLEILEYPGKLSPEKMAIMKTHVTITEEIITGIIDDDICKIAVRHHEKIDGSGYPHGLKGEELNTSQRIVAVADIMSALVGKRSYKDAFPKKKIISVLEQMSRHQKLCPKVCRVAIQYYDEITAHLSERYEKALHTYSSIMEEYQRLSQKFASEQIKIHG